jgi:glucosyl-dolichyl phosphate glucuronosyltransferase
MIKLSAIICTYNREKYLPAAIDALLNQKGVTSNDFEIVIINNNSTDKTEEIALSFKQNTLKIPVIYAIETKQGLSHARNKGIEVASGKYLAFLDDDAFADENYIKDVLEFFNNNPEAMAVGGRILLHFEKNKPTWYTNYLGSLLGYYNPWDELRPFNKKQYPRGSNMVYRKELFVKYGVFNPELGRIGAGMLGSEEKEMFQRIYMGDEIIYYLPQAVIYHMVPEERTKTPFLRLQSVGVGRSERIRILTTKAGFSMKIVEEIIKWKISFCLFWFFLFTFRPAKGNMLIRFRYWVYLGLRGKE